MKEMGMAKNRGSVSELPTLGMVAPVVVEEVAVVVPMASETPSLVTLNILTCLLEVPHLPLPESAPVDYQDDSRRIDMGKVTRERWRKVQAIRRACVARGQVLENGKAIKTNTDALCYLLDSLKI